MVKIDKQLMERGRALVRRGGPFSPDEQRAIGAAWASLNGDPPRDLLDVQLMQIGGHFHFLPPNPAPVPATPHDGDVERAAIAREAARVAEEQTRNAMFDAKVEVLRLSRTTWLSGSGRGYYYEEPAARDATPEKLRAAQQAERDAREAWRAAVAAYERAASRYTETALLRQQWLIGKR